MKCQMKSSASCSAKMCKTQSSRGTTAPLPGTDHTWSTSASLSCGSSTDTEKVLQTQRAERSQPVEPSAAESLMMFDESITVREVVKAMIHDDSTSNQHFTAKVRIQDVLSTGRGPSLFS